MGITYNKEYTPKDRRILTNGPRDRQRKQAASGTPSVVDSSIIEDLKKHIENLELRLKSKNTNEGLYTPEQVNAELEKAIKAETARLKTEVAVLKSKNEELEKRNRELTEELKSSKSVGIDEAALAEMISKAAQNIVSNDGNFASVDSGRPKIGTVFIDPVDKESKVESHFEVEVQDISKEKKDNINDKVAKLRELMGKMPSKEGIR